MSELINVPLIVITGGPCGGKSTGLAKVTEKLLEQDILPVIIPEMATLLFSNGIDPLIFSSPEEKALVQKHIFLGQLNHENIYLDLAREQSRIKNMRTVVLSDRGLLDGECYIDKNSFAKIYKKLGFTREEALKRYEGIILLVTAADGALKYYTKENNIARSESSRRARELDELCQQAYVGHEHFTIIHNRENNKSISFDKKIQRFVEAVFSLVGIPAPIESERKFRLLNFNESLLSKISGRVTKQSIVQTYLLSTTDCERRVREVTPLFSKGRQELTSLYFYTEKIPIKGKKEDRYEYQRIINHEEYEHFLKERDKKVKVIQKIRYNFVHNYQYLHLDYIHEPMISNPWFMEFEAIHGRDTFFKVPTFFGKNQDVTGIISNYLIAAGKVT